MFDFNMNQNRKPLTVRIFHIILFALYVFSTNTQADTPLNLPDLGDSSSAILSPEFERRLGQAFLSQVRKQANVITDPEIETYIRSIGYRLVSQSDNNTQAFTFFVINDPAINAFAAPGGIVGINSGVILNSDYESELAGVMAHEVTHVTQRHMAHSFEMQSKINIPMMAAMLGAILVATQNAEAGQAALVVVQGVAVQTQINFTNGNEEEADRIGMRLLSKAEFNPRGMPTFFEKLHKNSRYAANAPEFLRTHPLTANRISNARIRSETYPIDIKYQESRSFPFIKAKLTVMTSKDPLQTAAFFKKKLNEDKYGNDYLPTKYGYALAQTAAGNYDNAHEHLQSLLVKDPENISYLLATANLEVQRKNFSRALEIYTDMLNICPDYRPIVLSYTEALLQNRQPEKAKQILEKYGTYAEADLTYFEYLTRAEAEAGNPIESGMASAEYYYLSGETSVAISQLNQILRQRNPRPNYYQQEKLQARLVFFEQELKMERDMKLTR